VIAAAYASHIEQSPSMPLGIEIALTKPFYVPAATSDRVTSMFIKVPNAEANAQRSDSVTSIRLDPVMENDKVKVTVYALVGKIGDITTCRNWNSLKAITVATYVAGVDEEVAMSKLLDYGVGVDNKPLTFRVVPKRVLSPLPVPVDGDSPQCECASCQGLICCPNPGACLNCGSCGSVCCSRGGGGELLQ
jgi:hypothetical protein